MSLLETWLSIEASYSALLARRVRASIDSVRDELTEAIDSGEAARAVRIVESLQMPDVSEVDRKTARLIGLTALQFGTSTIRKSQTKRWLKTDADLHMLDAGTDQLFVTERVSIPRMLAETLAKGIDTPAQKADVPAWAAGLDEAVEDTSALISNLTTSRLVNYGALVQIRADRVTEYGLKVTLDGKTSKVCRELNRRKPRFKVHDGIDTLERALLAQDPSSLRSIQPWIPNTAAVLEELRHLPAHNLRARGWHVPPFHPKCRTIVIKIRQRSTVETTVIG